MISPAGRLFLRRCLRWRTLRLVVALFCLVNVLDVLRVHRNMAHGEARRHRQAPTRPGQRVYIASMHFNSGDVLRHHWNDALLYLTDTLGPANVFVSIFESGSWDDSKQMLTLLELALSRRGVPHRVETSNLTHHDELAREERGEGWIDTPRNKRELRRIPYLARLRNRTIKDLVDLHENGVTFDKVLFLNDVIFTVCLIARLPGPALLIPGAQTDDVLTLMDTNNGEYAAACSLDFSKPPLYYDTFALRDSAGRGHAMQTWPYFGGRRSRNALVNHMDAVLVKSCWNGIGM